jgi:hypothetical protein
MKKILFILLVLTSCSKTEILEIENATACGSVSNVVDTDNVITWTGAGPWIIQRYDMQGWPMQTDSVNFPTMKYERHMIGFVRVRPQCTSTWSRYVYLKG